MIARHGCAVHGCCAGGRLKLGFCNAHYIRFKKYGDPLHLKIAPQGAPKEFVLNLVSRSDWPSDDCIIWPFGRSDGYATIRWEGKPRPAHIIVCEKTHGPAPSPRHEVRHICFRGHYGCVNPNHLAWGTHAENMKDTVGFRSDTAPRGEKQWMAKLTEDDVRSIRSSLAEGATQQSLADKFGVKQPLISSIKRGKKWGWLE